MKGVDNSRLQDFIQKANDTFSRGEVIPHEWIDNNIWIHKPQVEDARETTDLMYRYVNQFNLSRLQIVQRLKDGLKIKHKKHLISIHSIGYYILLPREYVDYIPLAHIEKVKRAQEQAHKSMVCAPTKEMTSEQTEQLQKRAYSLRRLRNSYNEQVTALGLHNQ
jgi:hypothetical protein